MWDDVMPVESYDRPLKPPEINRFGSAHEGIERMRKIDHELSDIVQCQLCEHYGGIEDTVVIEDVIKELKLRRYMRICVYCKEIADEVKEMR